LLFLRGKLVFCIQNAIIVNIHLKKNSPYVYYLVSVSSNVSVYCNKENAITHAIWLYVTFKF